MNEKQINAMLAQLSDQRNAALNDCVNLAGQLAIANEQIASLTAERDAALALVSDTATVATAPTRKGKTNA